MSNSRLHDWTCIGAAEGKRRWKCGNDDCQAERIRFDELRPPDDARPPCPKRPIEEDISS